jgi:hypothetical protein
LAGRLHEAQEAREQSKLSHDKAERYYDKGIRDIQLKKGDMTYLHNPIAKRSRAKKLAYQYQGPYIILEKVSPLIYKLQIDADRSIIVHVNRLKLAHPSLPVIKETPKEKISGPKRQTKPEYAGR